LLLLLVFGCSNDTERLSVPTVPQNDNAADASAVVDTVDDVAEDTAVEDVAAPPDTADAIEADPDAAEPIDTPPEEEDTGPQNPCDDGNDCTTDNLITHNDGTTECTHPPVINCCGDGIIDELETCDGNCPVSCNDFLDYTEDTMIGSPDICNVTCTYSDAGLDTDGDTLTDYQEATDELAFTDLAVFNGLLATIGKAPDQFFSSADCGLFFGKDFGGMSGLFTGSQQAHPISAGWSYAAGLSPEYDDPAHYDFEPNWTHHDNVGVHNSFQILFSGSVHLDQTGTWCFSVDTGAGGFGPLDIAGRKNSCGRVFIDATLASKPLAETGYGSAASPNVGCLALEAGAHDLDIGARHFEAQIYKPTLDVRLCFGGEGECTPDAAIPQAQLRALKVGESPPDPVDPPDPDEGACVNAADASLIETLGEKGLEDAITPCGSKCFLAGDKKACVAECIASDVGLSPDCAACYAATTACVMASCVTACIDGGDDCIQCMADNGCQDAFPECSGLP